MKPKRTECGHEERDGRILGAESVSARYVGRVVDGIVALELQLAEVNVVTGSWQQRFEHKGICLVVLNLAIAIDADLAFRCFSCALSGGIEKLLRIRKRS